MKPFVRSFFHQPTISVAQELLGAHVWTNIRGQKVIGKIVEVEAYLGSNDPACHAARGMTKRNAHMFDAGGISYVYLIYGMYYCMNVVTEAKGIGAAVLIRAVEPIAGIDVMARRRKNNKFLTNGPGRLCEAFGITKSLSGLSLNSSSQIGILQGEKIPSRQIIKSPRIGISSGTDLQYRFFIKDNRWVSK